MVKGDLDAYRAAVVAEELTEAPPEVADAVVGVLVPYVDVETAVQLRRRCRRALARISPDLLRQRAKRAREACGLRRWVDEPGVDRWERTFPSEQAAEGWAVVDALARRYVTERRCQRVETARAQALMDLIRAQATIDVQLVVTVPATSTQRLAAPPGSSERSRSRQPMQRLAPTRSAEDLVEVVGLVPGNLCSCIGAGSSFAQEAGAAGWTECRAGSGALLDRATTAATSYRPSASLESLVRMRDGRCRFPGCSVAARFCDLDHVRPWPAGPTAAANLMCLCRRGHGSSSDGWASAPPAARGARCAGGRRPRTTRGLAIRGCRIRYMDDRAGHAGRTGAAKQRPTTRGPHRRRSTSRCVTCRRGTPGPVRGACGDHVRLRTDPGHDGHARREPVAVLARRAVPRHALPPPSAERFVLSPARRCDAPPWPRGGPTVATCTCLGHRRPTTAAGDRRAAAVVVPDWRRPGGPPGVPLATRRPGRADRLSVARHTVGACVRPPTSSAAWRPSRSSPTSSPPATSRRRSPTSPRRIQAGEQDVVLLGATGTGKSATTAWLVEQVQRPTLVMAPNKTLAAQLANEFRELLPNNAVEYFVSYYDYYQPEAYIPQTDTYIEKDSSINDEVERLRHSATNSLLTRRDVIVVASVSCIYGLGTPQEYVDRMVRAAGSATRSSATTCSAGSSRCSTPATTSRSPAAPSGCAATPSRSSRCTRSSRSASSSSATRSRRIYTLHPLTGEVVREEQEMYVFPASHYVAGPERMERAIAGIEHELEEQLALFEKQGKLLEAQRLRMRTTYDIEMMRQVGSCSGIENYSHAHRRPLAADRPPTACSTTSPRTSSSSSTSRTSPCRRSARCTRATCPASAPWSTTASGCPSAMDNRPLKWEEFLERIGQTVYLSATPGPYELAKADGVVEQIIRPTGLVDPEIVLKPTKGQIDDLLHEIRDRADQERARPGHDADQEDGRGPHRLPPRQGRPGALPALRGRHPAPRRAAARAAPGRVRRPGRHQPAARGPRPARGLPRRDPRRRQGGLPALQPAA